MAGVGAGAFARRDRACGGPQILLPFALLLALATAATPAAAALHALAGEARDPESGRVLYREQHLVRSLEGRPLERLVLYRCPGGDAFARKRIDYRRSAVAPEFELHDARRGYREGMRRDGDRVLVWSDGDSAPLVPGKSALVVDAGFDEFLRARWDRLLDGQPQRLGFLIPSLQRQVEFDVVPLGPGRIDGQPVATFRLKLGGLLGRVTPAVEVAYDAGDRQLRRFTGLTNQRDDRGRPLRARIDFAGPRQPAPASSWPAALAAPLVACALGQ